MKLFIVVLLSVISHIQCMSDEKREILKKIHMECFEETNVSPDLILKLKTGAWHLNNTELKNWTLCILRKYGLMTNEGVFRLDNALAMVPDKVSPKSHVIIKREESEKLDEEKLDEEKLEVRKLQEEKLDDKDPDDGNKPKEPNPNPDPDDGNKPKEPNPNPDPDDGKKPKEPNPNPKDGEKPKKPKDNNTLFLISLIVMALIL